MTEEGRREEGKGRRRGGILLCNGLKIGHVLAEILRISKLDWRDGGGKEGREGGKGRREGKKEGRNPTL